MELGKNKHNVMYSKERVRLAIDKRWNWSEEEETRKTWNTEMEGYMLRGTQKGVYGERESSFQYWKQTQTVLTFSITCLPLTIS